MRYRTTRHNVGTACVCCWAQQCSVTLREDERRFAHIGVLYPNHHAMEDVRLPEGPVYMAYPLVFMNQSGRAVRAVCHFYRIQPTSVLVLHDELDFPPGKVRLKFGGGHGGHNGIKDIMTQLGTADFGRLRIGIGHPGRKEQVSNYVLSRPALSEESAIQDTFSEAGQALPALVEGDREAAMRFLHRTR